MKINVNIRTILMAAVALMAAALSACTDHFDYHDPSEADIKPEVPSLQFDFNLMSMGDDDHSHMLDHGEDWENYIDPAKMRVLFFTLQGKYLCEIERRYISVISKDSHWTGTNEAYRVTIPQKALFPTARDGMDAETCAALNEELRQALMEDGIKVAVLANWPNFVEGPRLYDPMTDDPLLDNVPEPANLHLVYDPVDSKASYISDLTHSTFDNVYGVSRDNGVSSKIPSTAYQHICLFQDNNRQEFPLGGRMDVYSVWVNSLYKNQSDAESFIRKGLNDNGATFTYSFSGEGDSFKCTDYSYHRYQDYDNQYDMENIWRLWNFSAGSVVPYTSGMSTDSEASAYGQRYGSQTYWEQCNNNALIHPFQKIGTTTDNNVYTFPSGFDIASVSTGATNIEFNKLSGMLKVPTTMSGGDNPVQLINNLKNGSSAQKESARTKFKDFETKALHIRAYGEGTLRIKAAASGAGQIVVICKRPGINDSELIPDFEEEYIDSDGQKKIRKVQQAVFDPAESAAAIPDGGYAWLINPNSDQYQDVYIGAYGGTTNFYEIEYIRDRHIYDSGRMCIMPSAENPIPMYGVQNFDPIGDFITPNETFNMSEANANNFLEDEMRNKYQYKDVNLLRSLAKVEIRFNKNVFRNNPPTHVYMRVLNRSARCAPKDVKNPTEWIWHGATEIDRLIYAGNKKLVSIPDEADKYSFNGISEELKNIIEYGPLYVPGGATANSPEDEKIQGRSDYRDKTAWFHAIWTKKLDNPQANSLYCWNKEWDWNVDYTNDPIEISTSPDQIKKWPRIFNTRIDRSDYCRMHRVPQKSIEGSQYITYIMYVPEKNIDDTDDKGYLGATPKVCHIEVRFDGMNDVMNYDDDNCYRLYFTDYSKNAEYMRGLQRNNYGTYEKDKENFLSKLQPIVRNCHYIFTIEGINSDGDLNVGYTVCGEANRKMAGDGIIFN